MIEFRDDAVLRARRDNTAARCFLESKYLNNVVERDHRAIKRRPRPMLGFKTFHCARILLAGIELMHMNTI